MRGLNSKHPRTSSQTNSTNQITALKHEAEAPNQTLISTKDMTFPWKSIWNTKVPPRVAFFFPGLQHLTIDNLRKRNLIVIDWCCMSKRSGETIDYLLLHCFMARELWTMVFSLFKVQWIMPKSVLLLLAC